MLTRLVAASIAGGIAFFIVGFVIYGLILENMVMRPNMNTFVGLQKEMPDWVPLILANIVSALLLAYIFEVWAGVRTFAGGAKAGAIIMFLISLSFQLMFLAFWNLMKNMIPGIADVIASTILGAVCGGVIGMVLGMMDKKPVIDAG